MINLQTSGSASTYFPASLTALAVRCFQKTLYEKQRQNHRPELQPASLQAFISARVKKEGCQCITSFSDSLSGFEARASFWIARDRLFEELPSRREFTAVCHSFPELSSSNETDLIEPSSSPVKYRGMVEINLKMDGGEQEAIIEKFSNCTRRVNHVVIRRSPSGVRLHFVRDDDDAQVVVKAPYNIPSSLARSLCT